MKQTSQPLRPIFIGTALLFAALLPFVTWVLLWLRGLPSFAGEHPVETLIWVYHVTWMPSCLGGTVVALILFALKHRLHFFMQPYDIGRCASLGAVAGSLSQAFATWGYRTLTHHPFSNFWIAGALIAGCLTGAVTVSILLALPSPHKS